MSMAARSGPLNPEDLYQLKWLAGQVLFLLSVWTLFTLEIGGSGAIALAAIVMLAATLFPALPGRIPRWAWRAATPVIIAVIGLDFLLSRPDFLGPLIRMILLLGVYRGVAYRKRREDLQLIVLCLFMVIIAGVLTLDLSFAVQVLLVTPLSMFLLFLVTISECTDKPEEFPVAAWKQFRWGSFLGRLRRAFDSRLLLLAGGLFLVLVLLTGGIFVLMPRFRLDQALPFLNLQSRKSLSGFSDTISFGDVVDIMQDESVALRADLTERQSVPVTPYWRMVVLDDYHGLGFRQSFSARHLNRLLSDNLFTNRYSAGEGPPEKGKWTLYLEGSVSKYLPLPGQFGTLRFQNRQDVEYNAALSIMGTRDISAGVLFYQLEGLLLREDLPAAAADLPLKEMDTTPAVLGGPTAASPIKYPQTTLVVPAGAENQRLLNQMLELWGLGRQSPEERRPAGEFAARLVEGLNKRHGYALQSRTPAGSADPLVRWLISKEAGHCELFAGAFALLARQAGYPCRLVVGFAGGDWNGYENYYMIRNRDAHAWCEIYDRQTHRWKRVDPTPGARSGEWAQPGDESNGRLAVDRTFRAYLDSLRILWYRRIVNFDQEQQEELAGQVKSWSSALQKSWKEWTRQLAGDWMQWLRRPWDGERFKLVAPVLAALGLAGFLVIFLRRWWLRQKAIRQGQEWVRDPVRRRASWWLGKFRQAPRPSDPKWDSVYRELLYLRFGPDHGRPNARIIFRQARSAWRGK